MVSGIPRTLARLGGAQEADSALQVSSFKHKVHSAGSHTLLQGWQQSSVEEQPLLSACLGTCDPTHPSTGPLPCPTALVHVLQKCQRLLRSAGFFLGREPGERQQGKSMISPIPGGRSVGRMLLFLPRRKEEAWWSCTSPDL